MHYVPGPDLCLICVCGENGKQRDCKSVLCSPPQECKSFQKGKSCCEFICLDDTLLNNNNQNSNQSDFGI